MKDKIREMINIAHQALKYSYAPYSDFQVASCILTDSNQLFTGVNVENSAHNMAICAESSAICQMVSGGGRYIKDIVILAASEKLCSPCGACRQRIHEFSMEETKVHMCNKDGVLKVMSIKELLPLAFFLNPNSGISND